MDDDMAIGMQSVENALRHLGQERHRWMCEAERLRRDRDEWKLKTESLRLQLAHVRELLDDKDDALESIVQWADAYPLSVFPEPDFVRCAELLKQGGQTLDSVSASVLRQAIKSVASIAAAALDRTDGKKPDEA